MVTFASWRGGSKKLNGYLSKQIVSLSARYHKTVSNYEISGLVSSKTIVKGGNGAKPESDSVRPSLK